MSDKEIQRPPEFITEPPSKTILLNVRLYYIKEYKEGLRGPLLINGEGETRCREVWRKAIHTSAHENDESTERTGLVVTRAHKRGRDLGGVTRNNENPVENRRVSKSWWGSGGWGVESGLVDPLNISLCTCSEVRLDTTLSVRRCFT